MSPAVSKKPEALQGGPQAAAKGLFISGPDLMEFSNQKRAYVIDGMLPVGTTLCAGPPKSGKSLLASHAAIAVAMGWEFFGQRVTKGDVLYLDLDNADKAEAASRIETLLDGQPSPEGFAYRNECSPEDFDGVVRNWAGVYAANPRLVVVDLFENIRSDPDAKVGRAIKEDYSPVKKLNALSQELGIAMIAVAHTGKTEISARGNPFNAIAATNGLFAGAAGAIILDAGPMDKTGTLHVASRGARALQFPITRQDNGFWRPTTPEEGRTVRLTGNGRRIVQALIKAGTPMRVAQVAEATGIAEKVVGTTLKQRLLPKGIVRRAGRGEWEHAR